MKRCECRRGQRKHPASRSSRSFTRGASMRRPRRRVVVARERMWPADLDGDYAPYDDPSVRTLLTPARLALTRDGTSPQPRLVRKVESERVDRETRIWWLAALLRIARAFRRAPSRLSGGTPSICSGSDDDAGSARREQRRSSKSAKAPRSSRKRAVAAKRGLQLAKTALILRKRPRDLANSG